MGNVFAEITLRNGGDIVRARSGYIPEQNIRSVAVTALVDTGATRLVMGEDLREQLGLDITDSRTITIAGGAKTSCGITEPVELRWKNRVAFVQAWVLPGEDQVLLGVIPLEEMALIVDPVNQTLIGAYADEVMGMVK